MPLANVGECHRAIQLARPVLDAISSLRFGDQNNAQVTSDEPEIPFSTKRQAQNDRKKAKRCQAPVVDAKPFERLGVDVPSSLEEASILADQLLRDQKDILQVQSNHYVLYNIPTDSST